MDISNGAWGVLGLLVTSVAGILAAMFKSKDDCKEYRSEVKLYKTRVNVAYKIASNHHKRSSSSTKESVGGWDDLGEAIKDV